MSQPPSAPRRMNLFAIMALSLVAGGVVGAVSAGLDAWGGALAGPLIITIIVAAMVLALVLCLIWWRGADEAVREAHKWAWFWGGSAGMAVGGALMLIVQLRPEALGSFDRMSGADAFISGVTLVVGLEVLGYLIAWAWWWWSRR